MCRRLVLEHALAQLPAVPSEAVLHAAEAERAVEGRQRADALRGLLGAEVGLERILRDLGAEVAVGAVLAQERRERAQLGGLTVRDGGQPLAGDRALGHAEARLDASDRGQQRPVHVRLGGDRGDAQGEVVIDRAQLGERRRAGRVHVEADLRRRGQQPRAQRGLCGRGRCRGRRGRDDLRGLARAGVRRRLVATASRARVAGGLGTVASGGLAGAGAAGSGAGSVGVASAAGGGGVASGAAGGGSRAAGGVRPAGSRRGRVGGRRAGSGGAGVSVVVVGVLVVSVVVVSVVVVVVSVGGVGGGGARIRGSSWSGSPTSAVAPLASECGEGTCCEAAATSAATPAERFAVMRSRGSPDPVSSAIPLLLRTLRAVQLDDSMPGPSAGIRSPCPPSGRSRPITLSGEARTHDTSRTAQRPV